MRSSMRRSTRWSRKRKPLRRNSGARKFCTIALAFAATWVAAHASAVSGSGARVPPRTIAAEYLSDVLRDWRSAKKAGATDVHTRLALVQRAFDVADVAAGRERYE